MVDAMLTASTHGTGDIATELGDAHDHGATDHHRDDHERLITLIIVVGVTLFVVWNVRPWSYQPAELVDAGQSHSEASKRPTVDAYRTLSRTHLH